MAHRTITSAQIGTEYRNLCGSEPPKGLRFGIVNERFAQAPSITRWFHTKDAAVKALRSASKNGIGGLHTIEIVD